MYENNYPNNNYHYETGGGTNGYYQSPQSSGNQEKGNKKGFGTGKKIVVGICCGLCFGIFAGLGFQAVNTGCLTLWKIWNLFVKCINQEKVCTFYLKTMDYFTKTLLKQR